MFTQNSVIHNSRFVFFSIAFAQSIKLTKYLQVTALSATYKIVRTTQLLLSTTITSFHLDLRSDSHLGRFSAAWPRSWSCFMYHNIIEVYNYVLRKCTISHITESRSCSYICTYVIREVGVYLLCFAIQHFMPFAVL